MKANYTLESKSQAHAFVGFMCFSSFVGSQNLGVQNTLTVLGIARLLLENQFARHHVPDI